MKIAVINFSGNVGKTMVVHNLLSPNLPKCDIVTVETINDSGEAGMKIKGKEFDLLQDELLISDDLIVDIGASNVEETLHLMKQYKGSQDDLDYFILPTVPDTKQQKDTTATIIELLDMGIPVKKLRLVYNKVNDDNIIEFSTISDFAKKLKIPTPKVGIAYNEGYQSIQQLKGSEISELLGLEAGSLDDVITIQNITDLKDLRTKVRESKDEITKRKIANLIGLQRLAATANENLHEVFQELKL